MKPPTGDSYTDDREDIARFFATHPDGRGVGGGHMPLSLRVFATGAIEQVLALDRRTPHADAFGAPAIFGHGEAAALCHRRDPRSPGHLLDMVTPRRDVADGLGSRGGHGAVVELLWTAREVREAGPDPSGDTSAPPTIEHDSVDC